jgi:hypothetical protein
MLIALDYDKTYTADPALWDNFIQFAHHRGHEVRIVTMRNADTERIADIGVSVTYTDRKAKRNFIKPDIWIDDSPAWIFQDAL